MAGAFKGPTKTDAMNTLRPLLRTSLLATLISMSSMALAQPGPIGAGQPAPANVYPNPFTTTLNIMLPDPQSRIVTFELRDLHGNVILSALLWSQSAMQSDVTDVPEGLYVAYVIGQRGKLLHQQQVQRLAVQ